MPRDRYEDLDDEDDDDRPRKKRRQRDDDEDDYRPKRKKNQSEGSGLVWIYPVVGILVLGAISLAGFLVFRGEKKNPETEVAEKQNPEVVVPQNDSTPPPKPKTDTNAASGTDPSNLPVGVVPIPSLTPTVTQVAFGGGESGYAAIVSTNLMGGGNYIDVVRTATGKAVGRIQTAISTINVCAVSPDGSNIAILGLKRFRFSRPVTANYSRNLHPTPKIKTSLAPSCSGPHSLPRINS
jgi:hypothetical protein